MDKMCSECGKPSSECCATLDTSFVDAIPGLADIASGTEVELSVKGIVTKDKSGLSFKVTEGSINGESEEPAEEMQKGFDMGSKPKMG